MRGSTIFALFLAVVLAALAVVGTRYWLQAERSALLAENSMQQTKKVDQLVVAAEPLRFGERLTRSKVKFVDWPSGSKPAGSFDSIEAVIGVSEEDARFAISAIEIDEPVLAAKITLPGQRAKLSATLEEGMKAVSIRVNDVLGVAGFVTPGDRVDIMLTRASGRRGAGQGYVDVLLQGVKVLAIDQIADDRRDDAKVVRTVTFEVSTSEAQKLTLAANVGTLSLALRNVASSGIEEIDRVTLQDLGGGEIAETLIREASSNQKSEQIDSLSDRLNDLERSLAQKAESREIPTVQKKRPSYTIVGVTRGGKRQEYRFDENEPSPDDGFDPEISQDRIL